MGIDLSSYAKEQRKKGYTDKQIKSYLLGLGYSVSDIEKAMKPGFEFFHKKEPDKKIVSYIEQSMAKGYKPGSIKEMLARYYKPDDIKVAMKQAKKDMGVVHHVIDISNRMFILALFGIIIIGLIGSGIYLFTQSGTKLLDYELVVDVNEILPGEKLYFMNNFINMGDNRRYDIMLEYKITNQRTGTILDSKGETLGVSTTLQKHNFIDIPLDAATGRYRIEGLATYGSNIATSYANFRRIKPGLEPSCDDGILNQNEIDIDCGGPCEDCETENCYDHIMNQNEEDIDCGGVCSDCIKETCSDGIRNQDEEKTDCGGVCKECETPEIRPDNDKIIDKVKGLDDRDEKESQRLCGLIDDDRSSDECYLKLSQIFNKSVYCEKMISTSMSNICYMHFVQNKDYTVCDKIEDIWIRRSCESLRQINDILKETNQTMPNAQ